MTERVLGPTGSPRRRRTLLLPLIAVFALALLFVAGAQAVHDETFQLDGNTVAGPPTNLGGNTQSIDWNTLFDADGDTITPLPAGFDEATFDRDFTANGTSLRQRVTRRRSRRAARTRSRSRTGSATSTTMSTARLTS